MAAPPSLTAPSSPLLFLSFSLLLLLVLLLFLSAKKRTHPRPVCGEKERLDLRGDLPAWDPQLKIFPLGGGVHGGGEEEAAPGTDSTSGQEKGRRKKARKKRIEPSGGSESVAVVDGADEVRDGKVECAYPFSTFASATQRKIKLKYDEIVNSNQAKTLTMAQVVNHYICIDYVIDEDSLPKVGQFVNCLVDARNELQRKSETIQRSFRIKKALLYKANRSSFDRLCQQIYKLEAEHKRLEEDATLYNLLQEQLKLSPAYKTMLEVSTNLEQKSDPDQNNELPDISFEELLAQEKKDLFWQKNRKLR